MKKIIWLVALSLCSVFSSLSEAKTNAKVQTILNNASVWCSDSFARIYENNGQMHLAEGGASWAADSWIGEVPLKLISDNLVRKSVSYDDGSLKYELNFDSSYYTGPENDGLHVELIFTMVDNNKNVHKASGSMVIPQSVLNDLEQGKAKSMRTATITTKIFGAVPELFDAANNAEQQKMIKDMGLKAGDFIYSDVTCDIGSK